MLLFLIIIISIPLNHIRKVRSVKHQNLKSTEKILKRIAMP